MSRSKTLTRRRFMETAATAAAAVAVVPRHVLGGQGRQPPSETVTGALIGNGNRGKGSWKAMGLNSPRQLAVCDVDKKRIGGEPDYKTRFLDFRRVMERKDIDVVCIATPPHWHGLICVAAAQAGKDIFCEKPMTKFIAEGRAIADAVKKHNVVFQIGTFKRYSNAKNKGHIENHQIFKHGLMKDLSGTVVNAGAKNRTGRTDLKGQPVPPELDYDMWLGPAPYKPYHPDRVHYKNRFYWDYEGGDLTNFGAHSMDPLFWTYAKDDTGPVRIEPHAPWPQHPDAVGHYGWVELTFADGLKIIVTGGKWPKARKYDRPKKRSMVGAKDLDDEGRKKLAALSPPEPLVPFAEAIRTRRQAGGNAESSHRVTTALLLANIAIRTGRTIQWDPAKEQIVGDEEANRFVNIPMRAPWHL